MIKSSCKTQPQLLLLVPLLSIPFFAPLPAPAQSPPTNQYVLTGAGGGVFTVDDDLIVSVNGTIVFTDGSAASTVSHPAVQFQAKPGGTLTTQVQDTYGFCSSLTALYLSCQGGSTYVAADPGFNLGCGRPSGNQGIVHTNNFTIPTTLSCQPISIASVEFTQAIQQYQTLADLKASLTANGEPPVPIITGKFAAMRVYFSTVASASDVTLAVTGAVSETKTISLQPNCSPQDQRARNGGCQSMDFYFKPTTGTWTVNLTLTDSSGNQLEQDTLNVTSRDTVGVNLKSVTACDNTITKNCGSPSLLSSQLGTIGDLMPTANVTIHSSGATIEDKLSSYSYTVNDWDFAMAKQADALYTAADQSADFGSNQRTTYFGVYNPDFGIIHGVHFVDYSGWAAGIPSHGAVGPNKGIYLGVDDTAAGVAHEVAHTLNLQHTNIGTPTASTPPGCYGTAKAPSTYWTTYYSTNLIQSTAGLEDGYNVATQAVLDPSNTFDLMSYCIPQWISPLQYKRMVTTLGGGAVSSASVAEPVGPAQARTRSVAKPLAITIVNGPYWQIEGTIDPVLGVTFDPVFMQVMRGSPDAGSGTYSIQVLGAGAAVLYTRFFTPVAAEGDTTAGTTVDSLPHFSEWVPVTAGAASFKVLDPSSKTVGTVALTGSAPTVTITSPTTGFVGSTSQQNVAWNISSSTASSFTSRVQYSPDGGTTWIQIGQTTDTSDAEDFTQLPGSSNALIRILASDGINTGTATSVPFTVTKKQPSTVVINRPTPGFAQAAADPVILSGVAFDADDGFLTGSALAWTSSLQGPLGTGSPLSVTLQPGTHTLTLTATDSDGNSISTAASVLIGGARPSLTLITSSLSSACTGATISALPGTNGANLAQVQYSLDGGTTYASVALGALPYSFVVPGSGSISLVARAYDLSNQSAAASASLSLASACLTGTPSISGGNTQNTTVGASFTTPLAVLVKDGSGNPLSGVTVIFAAPSTGATATLSAASAVTGTNGIASITATANSTAGAYAVTASVIGFGSTVSYNLTNTDFSLSVDKSTIKVQHGSTATANFTIGPLSSFASAVTFACGTLPTGVTCSFSPASVTPAGANISTVLTIAASNSAKATAAARNYTLGGGGAVFAICLLAGGLRRRRRYVGLLALTGLFILLTSTGGCGAKFTSFTSTIAVTATSGTLTHTQNITVNVQ